MGPTSTRGANIPPMNDNHQRPGIRWASAIVLLSCVVGASGWVAFALQRGKAEQPEVERDAIQPLEVHEGGYRFISPLLDCGPSERVEDGTRRRLRSELQAFIEGTTVRGVVDHVSLYFRDLDNGPWIGINEKEKFAPASLLKVPLMMAHYREADRDPTVLSRRITYRRANSRSGGKVVVQTLAPTDRLVDDQDYPVGDLIEQMIVFSDNSAADLLLRNIDPDLHAHAYRDLGVIDPGAASGEPEFMTVKDYATFFRILFNASYLGKANSEKALALLSRTTYKDGLVAGVPWDITVAHKFGERNVDGSPLHQLHDCGIIYVPGRPYLLCVMTRGGDARIQASVIAEISRMVYSSVARE